MTESQQIIKKLFARRPFNSQERTDMQELYSFAEMFANQVVRLTPGCEHQTRALLKIKEALADCETAVALHPKEYPQAEMGFVGKVASNEITNANTLQPRQELNRKADMLEKEAHELRSLAAHARR
jgi:hypothetical protein